MDSRSFIKDAQELVEDIEQFGQASLSREEEIVQGTALQRRITNTFGTLYNPSLMSAAKLRDVAQHVGFDVDPNVLKKLSEAQQYIRWP